MLSLKFFRYRRPARGVDLYAQSAERAWRIASAVAIYFLAHALLALWPVFPTEVIMGISLVAAALAIWLPTLALFLILLAFTPSFFYVSASLALVFAAVWMLALLSAPARLTDNNFKLVLILAAPIVFQDGWLFAAAVTAGLMFGSDGVPAAILGGFFALLVGWLRGDHIVGVLPSHAPLLVANVPGNILSWLTAALNAPHFHLLLSLAKELAPHAPSMLAAFVVVWLVAQIAASLRGDRRVRAELTAAAVSSLVGVASWGVLADEFHPSIGVALAVLPGVLLGGVAAFAISRAWLSTDLWELRGVGKRLSPRISSAPKAASKQAGKKAAPPPKRTAESKGAASGGARASRRADKAAQADGTQAAARPITKVLASLLRTAPKPPAAPKTADAPRSDSAPVSQQAPKASVAEKRKTPPTPRVPEAKPSPAAAVAPPATADAVRDHVAPAKPEPTPTAEAAATVVPARAATPGPEQTGLEREAVAPAQQHAAEPIAASEATATAFHDEAPLPARDPVAPPAPAQIEAEREEPASADLPAEAPTVAADAAAKVPGAEEPAERKDTASADLPVVEAVAATDAAASALDAEEPLAAEDPAAMPAQVEAEREEPAPADLPAEAPTVATEAASKVPDDEEPAEREDMASADLRAVEPMAAAEAAATLADEEPLPAGGPDATPGPAQLEAEREDSAPAELPAVEPAIAAEAVATLADEEGPMGVTGPAPDLYFETYAAPTPQEPATPPQAPAAAFASEGAAMADDLAEPAGPALEPEAADVTAEPPASAPPASSAVEEPAVPVGNEALTAAPAVPAPAAAARPQVPTADWDEIAGYDDLKLTLREIARPYSDRDLRREFAEKGIQPVRGVLLYGPRGTGKSLIARVLAGASALPFLEVSARDFLASPSAEREEKLRGAFKEALDQAPSVLFLDGIEAFLPRPEETGMGFGEETGEAPPTLLTEIDALLERGDILVVGSANDPDLLDPAALLAGRFTRVFYVPLPDSDARRVFLSRVLKGREQAPQSGKGRGWRARGRAQTRDRDEASDLEALVDACEHFTTTDMLALVDRAFQPSAERSGRTTVEELTMLARLTKPSVTPRVIAHYQELAERFGEHDQTAEKDE